MSTVEPSAEQLNALREGDDDGPVVMLNLLRYSSRAAFLTMIADPGYLAVHAHRAAGVADSRLIACDALTA